MCRVCARMRDGRQRRGGGGMVKLALPPLHFSAIFPWDFKDFPTVFQWLLLVSKHVFLCELELTSLSRFCTIKIHTTLLKEFSWKICFCVFFLCFLSNVTAFYLPNVLFASYSTLVAEKSKRNSSVISKIRQILLLSPFYQLCLTWQRSDRRVTSSNWNNLTNQQPCQISRWTLKAYWKYWGRGDGGGGGGQKAWQLRVKHQNSTQRPGNELVLCFQLSPNFTRKNSLSFFEDVK